MKKTITWDICRLECGKELRHEDVVKNFSSYEAAIGRLQKIAKQIGTTVTKNDKGEDVIVMLDGRDAVIYWITGQTHPNTVDEKPQLFNKPIPKKYYQPEMLATGDVPSGLASFHVFRTRQECILWMESLGYAPATYEIKVYSGDDIEDPIFVDIKTQL